MHELLQLWENGQLNLNEVRQAFQLPSDERYGHLTYPELFQRMETKAMRLKYVPEDDALVDRTEAQRQEIEKELLTWIQNWLRSIHRELLSALHRKSFADIDQAIHALFDAKLDYGKLLSEKFKQISLKAIQAGGEQAAQDVGGTFDILDEEIYDTLSEIYSEFRTRQEEKYERVIGKIYEDARTSDQVFSTEALEERFRRKFEEFERNASKQIATTESVRLMMAGLLIGYKQNGIKRIYWHSEKNSCPFCKKLHGIVIDIGQTFYKAGDQIQAVDSHGNVQKMRVSLDIPYPPAHPNCRCSIAPVREEEVIDVEIIEDIEDDDIDKENLLEIDVSPPEARFDEESRSTIIPYRPNVLIPKSVKDQVETKNHFSDLLDEHDRKESDRETKMRITRNLYTWMKSDPDRYDLDAVEKLGEFFEEVGEFRHPTDVPRINYQGIYATWAERAIARTGRQWAVNSRYGALAISLQQAAKLEFHLTSSRIDHFDADYFDLAEKRGYFQHLDAFRGLLRAQYDLTQAWLKHNFAEDTIPLFRGMGFENPITEKDQYDIRYLHVQKRPLQPLSSFTVDPDMALTFANYQYEYAYRTIMGARVPRERILSTSQTGFGCKAETEMVVLGPLEQADDWWHIHFHKRHEERMSEDWVLRMLEDNKDVFRSER